MDNRITPESSETTMLAQDWPAHNLEVGLARGSRLGLAGDVVDYALHNTCEYDARREMAQLPLFNLRRARDKLVATSFCDILAIARDRDRWAAAQDRKQKKQATLLG